MGVKIVATEEKKTKKSTVSSSSKPKNWFVTKLIAVGGYFKGSWVELKQVRWPNRRSAWGLTAAVLLFTGMFLILIVSLDAIFNQLFNLIIK